MDERKQQNLEEVEKTLEEIKAQRKKPTAVKKWRRVLYFAFFPFVKLYELFIKLIRKIHIPITAKTTIIYVFMFAVALTLLGVFVVSSVESRMAEMGEVDKAYVTELRVTVAIVIVLSLVVITALGGIASSTMLSPIRKMIGKIDDISPDDLSTRIDAVDSQDELKELTERINSMLDELEQSFEQQKKFVSDASHELKTPIAVIQGYSNLLLRWGKNDPSVLDESVDSIAREAENMQRIVEQLLTLARMGKISIVAETLDLHGVLSEIAEAYSIAVKTHKVVFVGEKNMTVSVDKNLFVESIRALVDNAIKYSPEGSVVRIMGSVTPTHAVVHVADSGLGISKEDLPHIFDRFYRCDKSRNRDGKGTGLGLTIAKTIIESMHGTIEAKSEPGVGSTFSVRIPVKGGDKL